MLNTPSDFQYNLNSLYYKIGRHGLVFVWIDNAWIRSNRRVDQLKNGHTSPRREKYD